MTTPSLPLGAHATAERGAARQDYIPPHLFRLQKPAIWEADLIRTHEKMARPSPPLSLSPPLPRV